MKKLLITGLAISLIGVTCAYKTAENKANQAFEILGVSELEANQLMKNNLLATTLYAPYNAKKASKGNTKEMIVTVGNYMKDYFKSKEVADAYAEYRNNKMPRLPQGLDVNKTIADYQKSISQMEALKSTSDADTKQSLEDGITEIKRQLSILQNPNHPEYKMYAGIFEPSAEQKALMDKDMEAFNKKYPADVQQYVKLKLQDFLTLTANIDFDAKLVEKYGKMRFENPAYEAQSANWKKCFRAGKDNIATARAFAQQWINEIK